MSGKSGKRVESGMAGVSSDRDAGALRAPDRRRFLQAGALAGVTLGGAGLLGGGLSGPGVASARPAAVRRSRGRAKNVIFMVSDGMSFGTLMLADMLLREREGRVSHWSQMMNEEGVRRSLMATHAADSLVTDSAAAAAAWAVGERVNNWTVSITPDGREPEPVLVRARRSGRSTGLVTTTRVTHATPGAFIANVPRRGMEDEIAEQMIERGVDVVLGGGARHFPPELLEQADDLKLVKDRPGLEGALKDEALRRRGRLLGVFRDSHMNYELDREEEEPSLRELTEAALKILDDRPNGFVMQVEGGRVDHGAHANDAGGLVYDQIAFDEAVEAAWKYASARDDTLLIVTTDHGNANPGLTHYGSGGQRGMELAMNFRRSFSWILGESSRRSEDDEERAGVLPGLIEEGTGIEINKEEQAMLAGVLKGDRVHPYETKNRLHCVLGDILASYHGIAFLSPNHTSDPVEVTAYGPGSELIRPTLSIETLHDVMVEALDIEPAAVS